MTRGELREDPFMPEVRCGAIEAPALRELLGLRVSFGTSAVNAHGRELFVVRQGTHAERRDPDDLADTSLWSKRHG